MDDTELIILGRIAVAWGHLIFHLDAIALEYLGRTTSAMQDYPTRSLNRKLADLWREASKPENAEARPILNRVHGAIDRLASDRNVIFHGLWGYWLDRENHCWKAASKSYSREAPFQIENLREFHERLIDTSVIVSDAMWTLLVNEGEPPLERNRHQYWSEGPPSESDPPRPPRLPR